MWRRSQTDPELAAIEAVYREQLASFVRLATAITGEEQAYDAVHDAFVRAVRYRGRLRDREAAPGWVCRIVLNEARKRSSVERRVARAARRIAGGYAQKRTGSSRSLRAR